MHALPAFALERRNRGQQGRPRRPGTGDAVIGAVVTLAFRAVV
jgi:hypothetical protein